jgi:hypothetical protein
MSKKLTAKQFQIICDQFGREKFHRRPVDIRPGSTPLSNRQLNELTAWLDNHCINPYYVTKERRSTRDYTQDIVFYFTDDQDKMVFTLCWCEIFT